MRNKFVYSCSIKICVSGFDKLLESIFCILLVAEVFSLQKVVKMLEEVVVGWWEIRWIWLVRQNFIAQFIQLLRHWLYNMQLSITMEKNWALFVDQCRLQALQFLVHFIDLLSVLLICNSFSQIQKVVVDQMGSRPPVIMTFFWCKFDFGKYFGASSRSSHWAGHHRLSYKIHFLSHVTIWLRKGSLLLCRIREDDISKGQYFVFVFVFLNLWSARETPTYWAFSPFQFALYAQWPQNGRCWVLGSFSCSCRRIALMMTLNWSLTSDGQPLCSSSRCTFPLQNFLNHNCTVHSLAFPGPDALLMLWVVSATLWPTLKLSKKMAVWLWELKLVICIT